MTDKQIVDIVLAFEGGFVDHPADRGGPTNFGITTSALGRWRKLGRDATPEEVQSMTLTEARAIYQEWHIRAPGFNCTKSDKLRLMLVDAGVLHGVSRAVRWLQEELGVVADGVLGPQSRQALDALDVSAQDRLARKVLGRRLKAVADIVVKDQSQLAFLRGWIARAVELLNYV
jgi:lysozyme family protein